MRTSKFVFLEPSKVRHQHITLLDGYVKALLKAKVDRDGYELLVACSQSTHDSFSPEVRANIDHQKVFVMDPEKRRLILKSLVEFWCIARFMFKKQPGDKLLVTCLLPPALLMIELLNKVLRRQGVSISLHGELEALLDASMRDIRSYGYWIWKWWTIRSKNSEISLVVLDDFIKERLLKLAPDKIKSEQIHVLYHPIIPGKHLQHGDEKPQICFIGYRSRLKGFDVFEQMAARHPDLDFVAIGAGKVEYIASGETYPLTGMGDFENAIAKCDLALFPYSQGYDISLSAAALDALSAGVLSVASYCGCFMALQQRFGQEVVHCYKDEEELSTILGQLQLADLVTKGKRIDLVRDSVYSLEHLELSMRSLVCA